MHEGVSIFIGLVSFLVFETSLSTVLQIYAGVRDSIGDTMWEHQYFRR